MDLFTDFSPSDLGSNRAHSSRRLEPVLSLVVPRSNFLLPSLMSFVARQAFSAVRVQTNTGNSQIFSLTLAFRSFRHGLQPGPLGSCHPPPSSEKVCSLLESTQTRYTSSTLYCIDFVQDLYLKELKGYKPAPKVLTTSRVFTRPQPQLIRDRFPLSS